MKDQALIDRLLALAEAEQPAFFVLSDGAVAEDLDEALRLVSALQIQLSEGTAELNLHS